MTGSGNRNRKQGSIRHGMPDALLLLLMWSHFDDNAILYYFWTRYIAGLRHWLLKGYILNDYPNKYAIFNRTVV